MAKETPSMSELVKNSKEKKKTVLDRRNELAKELKKLEKLLPSNDLVIDKEHRKFLIDQANLKYRSNHKKLTSQIPMLRTSGSLTGRIEQIKTRISDLESHMGRRYLKKGSSRPGYDYTWSFKETEKGSGVMVNPDYNALFDTDIKGESDVQGLIADYGGKGKNKLSISAAQAILSGEGVETTFEPGKIEPTTVVPVTRTKTTEQKEKAPKDPMKTDIWTVDPRTGKEVGVITNAQRRNLELYLQKNNKKPERSPGLYIQSST